MSSLGSGADASRLRTASAHRRSSVVRLARLSAMPDIFKKSRSEGLTFISDVLKIVSDMKDIDSILETLGTPKGKAAKEMGLSRSYLYDITSGKRQPTVPVVGRVLSFLKRPENLKKLRRRRPLTFEEVFGKAAA